MKTEVVDTVMGPPSDNITSSMTHKSVMQFLHQLSGQEKRVGIVESEHSYAKPWNKHPDVQIRARPAKFLFMKNFPKHFMKRYAVTQSENTDIMTVDPKPTLSLLNHCSSSAKSGSSSDLQTKTTLCESDSTVNELPSPPKTGWTMTMNKLWTKAMKILHSDRLAKLTYDGQVNESILKRNLMDRSADKFRHLFATVASWDVNLLIWFHKTLCEYVGPHFVCAYHDSMQILRAKIPSLIDKFYLPPKSDSQSRMKQQSWDPIQTMLNNYKPKRINGSPLFLIVPNGPQIPHQMTSQRMKHWHNLFGSLGKVITITVHARQNETAVRCLNEIRYAVRDKIKECKTTFNEGRPLVLVGFGHSSLIAAHCALENATNVNATICFGFPLTAINGFRGDLDDPLLETVVPTLFIIGQISSMATLDDMEDFRERITKTETGLIVVGGANDRLIVSNSKKKFDGITQSIVDRCIADEIYDFVSGVLNPNSSDHHFNTSGASGRSYGLKSGSNSLSPKPKRKRPPRDRSGVPRPKRPRPSKAQSQTAKTQVSGESLAVNVTTNTETAPINTSSPIISNTQELLRAQLEKSNITTSLQSTPEKVAKVVKGQTEELTSQSVTDSSIVTPPISIPLDLNTPLTPQTPKSDRPHHGVIYELSEMPTVISQSASRSGRMIRAPKSLDV